MKLSHVILWLLSSLSKAYADGIVSQVEKERLLRGIVPGNDLCVNAVDLQPFPLGPFTQSISGTNVLATDDGRSCGVAATPGVWYKVQVDTSATWTVSTCEGATFDTMISVFKGDDCNNLICQDGNDDACGLQSSVSVNTGCATYFILVHGFSGQTGRFNLTITSEATSDVC